MPAAAPLCPVVRFSSPPAMCRSAQLIGLHDDVEWRAGAARQQPPAARMMMIGPDAARALPRATQHRRCAPPAYVRAALPGGWAGGLAAPAPVSVKVHYDYASVYQL